jgi:translocation and assembly module TamA
MRRSPFTPWFALVLAAAALPALADIKVEVKGVDGPEHANVLARLSVNRYSKVEDAKADKDTIVLDKDTMNRLCNNIQREVEKALQYFGYYDPTVIYDCAESGKDWQVAIEIKPGDPVRVRELDVHVEGPGAQDEAFRNATDPNLTRLREGMRLNHGIYDQVRDNLLLISEGNGYREARLVRQDMDVDPANHSASIHLVLDTGPRYSFGRIDIEQTYIRPELMSRFLRFREGDLYSATELSNTQFALDDSLYFSQVEMDILDSDPQTLTVPVRIRADKSRPTLSLGGGYGTDTGVRGTLGWTDARVNDRGHRFRVEIKGSTRTRQVDSRYDIPIGDPALERLSLEGQNSYDEPSDIKTNTTTLTPSVTRVFGRWQTVTSLAATRTTTDEGAATAVSKLLVPGIALASVPKNFLGESLFSRAFYAELIGSHSALGSDSDFLRLMMQSERSFNIAPQWHLQLRGEIGAAFVNDFSDLPGIYRFFAGGDRSVRGFAYKSLSPEEEFPVAPPGTGTELRKTGGRYLLVGSTELVRDLPRNFAVATFFDFGNAINDTRDPLQYAAGLGVRYRISGISIGFDVAKPLSYSNSKLRLHLNFAPTL